MHPPVAAVRAGGVAPGPAPPAPAPPPRLLRQGWLKCRTDADGVRALYEDFWCVLDSNGVLSFYREAGARAGGARAALALALGEALLEEHPEAAGAPGARGLPQLGWALRRRGARACAGLQLRAASVRERAVWLALLSPFLAPRSHAQQQLFAFMNADGAGAQPGHFRSLPRPGVRSAGARSPAAATGSLRKTWRASLGAAPPDAAPPDAAPPDAAAQAPPVPAPRFQPAAEAALRRRPSLREVVRRAGGRTGQLCWSRLPEVAAERVAERLSAAQQQLESLRFALAAWEAAYNAELAPLVALAKRTVGWHDATPVYARRTAASVVEKVKKCSDGALYDMEQMWQQRLTFDGILAVLQKHMDKFEIFVTYSNHLNELSNVLSGAQVKKSEVQEQAHSELYDLPRVFLPFLHLTVMRKILQEMRSILEVTSCHLDYFHCKRTLLRITEVLEECYKVVGTAYDSAFVKTLDKKLNDCCESSTKVTFPEVLQKQEINSVNISKSSSVNKENELNQISSTNHSKPQGENIIERTKSILKTPSQTKTGISVSENGTLRNKLNGLRNRRGSFMKDKIECTDDGMKTKRHETSVSSCSIENKSNLPEMSSSKRTKLNLVLKGDKLIPNSIEKPIVMKTQRISIVDIPLNDDETFANSAQNYKKTPSNTLEENLLRHIEKKNVKVEHLERNNSETDLKYFKEYNVSAEKQDFYEENSDHSESSRSTLYDSSEQNSSSECTLNDFETSNNVENKQVILNENCNESVQKISASGNLQCCSKVQEHSDETIEHNYDYVYVMDGQSASQGCECITCNKQMKLRSQCLPEKENAVVIRKSDQATKSPSLEPSIESHENTEYEENIYEDIRYVDMNSQVGTDSEVTTVQDSDQSDIYDDIAIYVKPDAVSIRSSSERSRYSSDSGNIEDGFPVYYNSLRSIQHSSSLPNGPVNIDDQGDAHDESDSAIDSGSDTGRLRDRKLCRTPSNASLTLHNMVRWKNASPRREKPLSTLQSPFEDAPLYQEYYRTLPRSGHDTKQSAAEEEEEGEEEEEEEDKTYIYAHPQEHVYETLDAYLHSRNMVPLTDTFKRRDKKERTDSRRTQWHETEEVIASGLLDHMSLEQRKLQEAKFEIITSEVSFLKSLNILEKYFINNSEVNNRDVLSEEERRILFMPIVPVKETSQCFLQDLVKVWEDDICLKNTELGEVMLKYAKGRFRVYIAYCSRQVDINYILSQLREKNKKFIEVMEKIEAKPVCQAFTLQSFLTQPMQRITRFPMLISAILRHLPEGDKSIPLWENTLSTLQTVVTECNEAVRNAERTLWQRNKGKDKKSWPIWPKWLTK